MKTEAKVMAEWMKAKSGKMQNDERYLKGFTDALDWVMRDD